MTRLDDGARRLRSGRSVWQTNEPARAPVEAHSPCDRHVLETDIVIVGAGITGAFLAERFTRAGRRVVMIDRRAPATGSTAASTAMLLWELDASLLELEDRLGIEAAGRIARQCRRQVAAIGALVGRLGVDCDFRMRPSIYLAGSGLDASDLREERRIRAAVGIEGDYLDESALALMGLRGDGALFYQGSAEVDPISLARGLIAAATARGAVVVTPATAMIYGAAADGVTVEVREGQIVRGAMLVLANGYEMPDFVAAARHRLVSSWAIATKPARRLAWPDHALVWEASDPYLYMRSTTGGRYVIGGEDEDFADADTRERMTPLKVEALLAKAAQRCPSLASATPDFAWSGVFGMTEDSLPLIGRVPGQTRCLAAFGYGGNGITFSAMAAEILEAELEGRCDTNAALYALDRN